MSLTRLQKERLLSVAQWGHVFSAPYSYAFLVEYDLIRRPTTGEIEEYYTQLAAELEATRVKLVELVQAGDYTALVEAAEHAQYLTTQLKNRCEDLESMSTLSQKGLALVAKLKAAQVA